MVITPQLEAWMGELGNSYTARNDYADYRLEPGVRAFERIFGRSRYPIRSVLEVGSNIGLNLWFLNELWQGTVGLYAAEPNRAAFETLTTQSRFCLAGARQCDVFNLPFDDNSIDCVFTSGVLIHIHPDDLAKATDEIVRVSNRYVLCIEYFSHVPVEIQYRSQTGLLFKRDFGSFYLDRFPQLGVVDYGFLWEREFKIFDNLNWWLFQKQ